MISDATAEARPAFTSTRPLFSAAPSITSDTVLTRPSSVNQFRISPTTSPPATGISRIQYHASASAWLCSRCTSSTP